MRTIFICILFLLGSIACDVSAGEIKKINLKDGSTIHGEILSLSEGVYTIESVSLGSLKIEESKIGSITSPGNIKGDIQAIQQQIISNSELLNIILPLQDNPDFKSAMEDPSIIEAVNAGDMEALLSNEKFIKLLSNPEILNIRDRILE